MKKILSFVLAVTSVFLITAGISFKAADYHGELSRLSASMADEPESGCFIALAVRKDDPDADLTDFGTIIASKDVPVNAVTAMKYALTVYACGVKGSKFDSLGGETIRSAESTAALVFALHLKNIGYDTGMTAEEHVERLLSKVTPSGGFPTVGTTPDIDMTAMAVQALSPYKNDERIAAVIDRALGYLSSQQTASGAFRYYNNENCENCAQVVLALTSLGIDPQTDERFIKDGVSVYDALLSYRLDDGGFEHIHGEGRNGTATAQAYCALVNKEKLTPFYVTDEPSVTVRYRQPFNGDLTPIVIAVIAALGVTVCVIMVVKRRKRPADYIIVAAITAAAAIFVGVVGVRTGRGYFETEEEITPVGSITFTVDSSLVDQKTPVPAQTVPIGEGDTAYSVLIRVCRANGLTVVNSGSRISPYISGIGDLYEAAYGPTSGWGYRVNGKAPSVGSGSYVLSDGDVLEWLYVPDVSFLGD